MNLSFTLHIVERISMPIQEIGSQAPDFTLSTQGDGDLTLSSLKDKNAVVYCDSVDMTNPHNITH